MKKEKKIICLIILIIVLFIFFIFDAVHTLFKINLKDESNFGKNEGETSPTINNQLLTENLYSIGNTKVDDSKEGVVEITTTINLDNSINSISKDNVLKLDEIIKEEVLIKNELFNDGINNYEYVQIKEATINGNKIYLLKGNINEMSFVSMYGNIVNLLGNKRIVNKFFIVVDENKEGIEAIDMLMQVVEDMENHEEKENNNSTEEEKYLESINGLYSIYQTSEEEKENLITFTTIINLDDSVNKLSTDNVLELQNSVKEEVLTKNKLFENGIYEFQNTEIEEKIYKGNKTIVISGTINKLPFLSVYSEVVEVLGTKRGSNLFYISTNGSTQAIEMLKGVMEFMDKIG